jgi:hypothetical protein
MQAILQIQAVLRNELGEKLRDSPQLSAYLTEMRIYYYLISFNVRRP